MAVIKTSNQQLFTSKSPLDYKALIQNYSKLISEATWTVDGAFVAYNGMITAVWCDSDATKNGVYFLLDPEVKSTRGTPKVTVEDNWHKLAEISEITALANSIDNIGAELLALGTRVDALEAASSDIITYGYRSGFPSVGEAGKLYVAADEGKTYVWFNDAYLPVGGSEAETPDIEIIYGGSAD